jgi:hypothetical protein
MLGDVTTLARIAGLTGSRSAHAGERIQSLWSGYGEIRRVHLEGGPVETVVVKQVRPPPRAHPRKLRSYEVEQSWYQDWAARCPARIARCLGVHRAEHEALFVLEDLDAAGFPRRGLRSQRDQAELCLSWLARFHAAFLGCEPRGLWPVGTYWHLATRPEELARMTDRSLRRLAPKLDAQLSGARFQTLVHGDAKPANFCFSADGLRVAAVDFQYVGGGCGMKDVAYLLGGPEPRQEPNLDFYFQALRAELPASVDAEALEAEWRGLYEVAWMDFQRFLDGWR